jgi:hypothetical protein
MGDVFTNPLRILVESAAEADQFAGVGQPLEIGERNARRREVARSGNPSCPNQGEGALAIRATLFVP